MAIHKIRMFTGAAIMTLRWLAISAPAHARPEPIPRPVAQPAAGISPGTGQEAPEDPEDPPPIIQPPAGLDCIAGMDQSVCDPGHAGDDAGKRPGNTPPDAWYDDMALQMYNLQEGLDDMADWGARHDPYIGYYATWMKSVVQQYYAVGYGPGGKPRHYSYGRMTRGDFNYHYYYWVRPIYYSLLYYSVSYYETYYGRPEIYEYQNKLSHVVASYHGLVLCNYGFNGDDAESREDLTAYAVEDAAGVRR